MGNSSHQSELGPVLPSRLSIYAQASEILALARLAAELTGPGPNRDLPRALRQMERIRAVVGEGQSSRAPGQSFHRHEHP